MPTRLLDGHKRFLSGYFQDNKDKLLSLAQGQAPSIAIISCCDARVDPAIIFDTAPGDLFVIRNVANLVPPFENAGNYHGTSAALEYAVTKLHVQHIVVLGHARCGGIQALLSGDGVILQSDFLNLWMSIAKPVSEHIFQQEHVMSDEETAILFERAMLSQSRNNLLTFPWVRSRTDQGLLTLHAWYYDLGDGSLEQLP